MKKFLILSLLTLFCLPVHADEIDFAIDDLVRDTKTLCTAMGGTIVSDGTCQNITIPNPTIKGVTSKAKSPEDAALVAKFKGLCEKECQNSVCGRIEIEDDIKPYARGESHTCWFDFLKEKDGDGQKNVTQQLKLCDKLNKSLGGDRVSWHGRNKPYGNPTERGCYVFAPYMTDVQK